LKSKQYKLYGFRGESLEIKMVWKENKWLYFELIEKKPKTNVFAVMSKCGDFMLGIIKWYPAWRHYCFFPTFEEETVYSDRCLKSISEFITELNGKHKNAKKGQLRVKKEKHTSLHQKIQ
jgi:hypothetical protein